MAPHLDPTLDRFVPEGMTTLGGDQDKLDIFGCGAILFEMLVGDPFKSKKGDAQAIIAKAQTAAEGETIPAAIASILIKSLDIGRANAYKNIRTMAKEMDELLFSGEYSPTTFNLAFFMHSAFREEMEALGEKIAREKETNYAAAPPPVTKVATPPPAPAAAAAAPPIPPVKVSPRQERPVATPAPKRSKMPLILGGVALLVIAAVVAAFFLLPKEEQKNRFDQEADILRAEGEAEQEKLLEEEVEDKDREIELLKEELARERQLKAEQEKKELEAEMLKMDEEIARLNQQKDQERRAKDLEDKLKQMQVEKAALAKREAEARDEADKARQEAERLAQDKSKQKDVVDEQAGVTTPDDTGTALENKTGSESSLAETTVTTKSADGSTQPVEAPPKTQTESVAQIPQVGDIVDADDQYLTQPVIESNPPVLEIPRKAIRDKVFKRDSTATFLMKILVNENGRVYETEIYRQPRELSNADTDYGMLEKARRTAKKLRYTPPNKMGVNVKVWMYVAIHFRDK